MAPRYSLIGIHPGLGKDTTATKAASSVPSPAVHTTAPTQVGYSDLSLPQFSSTVLICSNVMILDLVWMESTTPSYEQAAEFAEGIHAVHPGKVLAYNLSPSFNWKRAIPEPTKQASFINRLGELGYVWQFITLAGLHATALSTATFAQAFSTQGMQAYVEQTQAPEREEGVDVLTHQKWSGAG